MFTVYFKKYHNLKDVILSFMYLNDRIFDLNQLKISLNEH